MSHALTANFGQRDLCAAFFTHNTAVFHALIFAAKAFVIFDRAKNCSAKQTISLWLERTVIDRFRFLHLAKRPRTNQVRWCKTDPYCVKIKRLALSAIEIE